MKLSFTGGETRPHLVRAGKIASLGFPQASFDLRPLPDVQLEERIHGVIQQVGGMPAARRRKFEKRSSTVRVE